MRVFHEFEPFYNSDSKILILGSIPSIKSREQGFYYGHPQNRFWLVLAQIFKEKVPITIKEKKEFLKKHNIALWDVLDSCEIENSSDSSIKDPTVNDIRIILNNSKIERIYTAGKTAYNLYNKYLLNKVGKETIYLPSTSPANCKMKLEDLVKEYQKINYEKEVKLWKKL